MDQPSPTPPPSPASDLPPPKKRDTRGGKRPGAGLPKGTQLHTKRTYDPDALVDSMVKRLASTGSMAIKPVSRLGPVTDEDRRVLQRVTGLSAEEINARLISKMAAIADATADRVLEKLDADAFKPGELGFILSVAIDKRQALDGSRQLQGANVHNQILVVGDRSREDLMNLLEGRKLPAQLPTQSTRAIDTQKASINLSDASHVAQRKGLIPPQQSGKTDFGAPDTPIDVETAPDRTQRPQDRPPSAT